MNIRLKKNKVAAFFFVLFFVFKNFCCCLYYWCFNIKIKNWDELVKKNKT